MKKKMRFSSLLAPDDSVVIVIDPEPRLTSDISRPNVQQVASNIVSLMHVALHWRVPTILTTQPAPGQEGQMSEGIADIVSKITVLPRSRTNPCEDTAFANLVRETARNRLIVAGFWTEGSLSFMALSALEEGYDVYIVTDAVGGTSKVVHDTAISRLTQAGAVPVTCRQVALEWNRDSLAPESLVHSPGQVRSSQNSRDEDPGPID